MIAINFGVVCAFPNYNFLKIPLRFSLLKREKE